MYEVVLIDKNNKTEKHPFDNNLSDARKLLQESYSKQTPFRRFVVGGTNHTVHTG